MNKQTIRDSIDTGLSGMEFTRRSQQAVLDRIKGGKPVKKKLSLALVFAIILALAAASALAATLWHNYYDTIGEKEYTEGYFESWSAADKAALVNTLIESGIPLDAEKTNHMNQSDITDAQKEALAEEVIYGYYGEGRHGALTLIDMIAKELDQQFEFWPLELKAMYGELNKNYNPSYEPWHGGYALPGEDDLTLEEATSVAREALKAEYKMNDEVLNAAKLSAEFGEWGREDGSVTRNWKLTFYTVIPEPGVIPYWYSVEMYGDGEIYRMEEAQNQPQLTGGGELYPAGSIGMRFYDWYIVSKAGLEDAPQYGASENLDNVPDINLWSIEGLALFAKEWAEPVIDAYKNNESIWPIAAQLATIPYALPSDIDIPQDEALRLAEFAVAEKLGWDADLRAVYGEPSISFRIYENESMSRVWRVGFHFEHWGMTEETAKNEARAHAGDIPLGACVYIDAVSGDVISVTEWDNSFDSQYFGEFDDGIVHIERDEPDSLSHG